MPDTFVKKPEVGHNSEMKMKISWKEAEKRRSESNGYCTNLTYPGAMEIAWKTIDNKAKIVKYRYYSGKGMFYWGNWFEIEG
jgi:hypothetical protein